MPTFSPQRDFQPGFHTFFHTKREVMRASVHCRIRMDRQSSKKEAPVYLQVIINSRRTTVPLHISWPVNHFDNKEGLFLPRKRVDQEATDWNHLVIKEKAKVNDIFMFYRHSDSELTVEQFLQEYKNYDDRKDFIKWIKKTVDREYDLLKISKQTWKNRKYQLSVLEQFKGSIMFSELNLEFIEFFESWCRKKEYSHNTISSLTRMILAYARKASKKGIGINLKSLELFSPKKFIATIIYLTPKELELLEEYHKRNEIPDHHKRVLDHFLFSCFSGGLRFSDIQRVSWTQINDNILKFIPYKGRQNGREITIPLTKKAFSFIQNETGKLFNTTSEQKTNKALKQIAKACGIRKKVTTHVARHTFATEFLRRGGHIEVLKELLGHTDISTTMIYVHVDTDRLIEEMIIFNQNSLT